MIKNEEKSCSFYCLLIGDGGIYVGGSIVRCFCCGNKQYSFRFQLEHPITYADGRKGRADIYLPQKA